MTHDYKRALVHIRLNLEHAREFWDQDTISNLEACEAALQHMIDKEKSAKYEKTYKWTHEPNPADTSQNEEHGV
jgi:hypothetical protein